MQRVASRLRGTRLKRERERFFLSCFPSNLDATCRSSGGGKEGEVEPTPSRDRRFRSYELVRPTTYERSSRKTFKSLRFMRKKKIASKADMEARDRFVEHLYDSFCRSGTKYPELRRRFLRQLERDPDPQALAIASLRILAERTRLDGCPNSSQMLPSKCVTLMHLVLDIIRQKFVESIDPADIGANTSTGRCRVDPELRDLGKDLFWGTIVGDLNLEPRLMVKIARCFGLSQDDGLEDIPLEQLKGYVAGLLQSEAVTSAVALLHLFDIQGLVDMHMIKSLANGSYDHIALDLVSRASRTTQHEFIANLLAEERYKFAWKSVVFLGLEGDFPDVQRQYSKYSVRRYCGRGFWEGAILVAGEDEELQEFIIREMASAGELTLAKEHCDLLGLDDEFLGEVDVAALQAHHRAKYLQIADFDVSVSFIDDICGASHAVQVLCDARAIGLDVEWKATTEKTLERGASLLQLATTSDAFIFDIARLGSPEFEQWIEFDHMLAAIFRDTATRVLGFDLATDLRKLRSSFPHMPCFSLVNSRLDLQRVWKQLAPGSQISSLSKLCQEHLGKPLDKRVRMSNWEKRPLTASQLDYAALDAYCLIPLHEKLKVHPNFESIAKDFQ